MCETNRYGKERIREGIQSLEKERVPKGESLSGNIFNPKGERLQSPKVKEEIRNLNLYTRGYNLLYKSSLIKIFIDTMKFPFILAIILILIPVLVSASSTQQFNNIRLNPYYRNSMSLNTNYTYNVTINPPDNIASVISAVFGFNVFTSGQSTNYTFYINGNFCGYQYVDTAFANAGQYYISFDCSSLITKSDTYNITLRPSANAGSSFGWLDLTYMNNPATLISSGTEYTVNESARVFLRLLDGNENPINLGSCNTTIYYPNNTKFVNNQYMTLLEKGYYYYDLTIPNILGNYIVGFDCLFPSSTFIQNQSIYSAVGNTNPYDGFFPFDDSNNVTINSAYIVYSQSSGGTGSLYLNGNLIRTNVGAGVFNTSLFQNNFTIADSQSYSFVQSAGTPFIDWVYLYVNYTANDPTHMIRGQNEMHVSNIPAYVWNYENRSLTNYTYWDLKFNQSFNNQSYMYDYLVSGFNQTWNNQTKIYNYLIAMNASIWSGLSVIQSQLSTVTDYVISVNNTVLASNASLSNQLSVIQSNLTTINNNILSANTSLANGQQQILGNLSIIQQNLTTISNQVLGTNTSVHAVLGNIGNQIAVLNNTMLSNFNLVAANFTYTNNLILSVNSSLSSMITFMNTSIMNKLNSIDSEIISVNNSVDYGFNNLQSNITDIRNDISSVHSDLLLINTSLGNMITDTKNTILSVNQTTMNKLDTIQSNITTSLLYLNQVNNTLNILNTTVVTNLPLIYGNFSQISGKIDNVSNLVYASNQSIMNQLASVQSDLGTLNLNMASNFTYTNNLINATNSTIMSYLQSLPSLIWGYANRTLTEFNFLVNLAQASLDQILIPIYGNFTYTNQQLADVNNTLYSLNNTFFSELQTVQSNLISVNNTVKDVNASLSGEITTVYNHIGDVLTEVANVNNTVISINTTTMNKLFKIQDEITSVNDTMKNMNLTLPASLWEYNNRTLTSFNFVVNINATDVLNELTVMKNQLVSVNNTVKSVNATLSSDISGVYNHVTDAINDIAAMNNTMISINTTTMWKLYRIQDEITSVNDTVKALNITAIIDVASIWDYPYRNVTWFNSSDVAYEVWTYNNRTLTNFSFVVDANITDGLQNIMAALISVNNTVKDTNTSLSNHITLVYNHIGDVLVDLASLNNTMLTINSTTMSKLLEIQQDIYGVNTTDLLLNMNTTITSRFDTIDTNMNDLKGMVISVNNSVFAINNTIMAKLYMIQDEITSVNNTVKSVNVSLSYQIANGIQYVYDHITDVINNMTAMNATLNTRFDTLDINLDEVNQTTHQIASDIILLNSSLSKNFNNIFGNLTEINNNVISVNGTILAVNTTIMNKLYLMQDELKSINDTVKYVNSTLSLQISDVYNHISEAINVTLSVNDTLNAYNLEVLNRFDSIDGNLTLIQTSLQNVSDNVLLVNQSVIDAINALNFSTLTANDVWTFSNRTLTDFNFNVTCITCNLTEVLDAVANMNDSMFAINTSTFVELLSIQDDIATANNSIYSVNSSLSQQLTDTYNQIGFVITDLVSHNNTLVLVNTTIMNKLYKIQDEITSVNNTIKNVNSTLPSSVWTYYNRTLTNFTFNTTALEALNALATFRELKYAGGTEYHYDEAGTIAFQFISIESGSPTPVNTAECNTTVWYPNKTSTFLNNQPMTYIPASQGLYYRNFTTGEPEGVYTSEAICHNETDNLYGYGSSSFHVAPWANKIYLLPNETSNVSVNVSDDLYYRIRNFIVSWESDNEPTNRTCVTNDTLRVTYDYSMNVSGTNYTISKYNDYYCTLGCDGTTLPPSCKAGSIINVWWLIILGLLALFMMFLVPSKIVNMLGAFIMIILGAYIIVTGIEFSAVIGFVGTAGSYTINNTLTYAIGFIFIALGLFKVAVAWAKLQK